MKGLIVTADDFGAAPEVNEAAECAHRKGILTTASLMVGAPAAGDAIRALPEGLNEIYLHAAVSGGYPGSVAHYRYADEYLALTDPGSRSRRTEFFDQVG